MEKDVKIKRPVGRPKVENASTARLPVVRVTPKQLESYRSSAKDAGATLSC